MAPVRAEEAGVELLNQNRGGPAKVSAAADQQQPEILCRLVDFQRPKRIANPPHQLRQVAFKLPQVTGYQFSPPFDQRALFAVETVGDCGVVDKLVWLGKGGQTTDCCRAVSTLEPPNSNPQFFLCVPAQVALVVTMRPQGTNPAAVGTTFRRFDLLVSLCCHILFRGQRGCVYCLDDVFIASVGPIRKPFLLTRGAGTFFSC